MLENLNPPAIYGEAETGEAKKVLKQVKALVSTLNTSTFDLMDALHTVKSKKYYAPKHASFIEYAKTLDIKTAKAYYLVRIRENMFLASIPREKYEPVGIAKLRTIASIDLVDGENQIKLDAVAKVNELIETAMTTEPDAIKGEVDKYLGNVGDEAFEWINVKIRKSAKDVVKQAFDLIRMQIGSTGKDSEGNSKDASDGNCLEKICADYLSDPNQQPALQMLGLNAKTQ